MMGGQEERSDDLGAVRGFSIYLGLIQIDALIEQSSSASEIASS